MSEYNVIAESRKYIILDKYEKIATQDSSYQSEKELEEEFIDDLQNLGYEYLSYVNTPEKMLANARIQLQELNNIKFNDSEWQRFVIDYLDKPNDGLIEKSKNIHDNDRHNFTFDDGTKLNISLFDKINIIRNKLQVINQFEQNGEYLNRYDVTILINGIPLIQVELKKRGTAIKEAFNQIHRYTKESFNNESSLFKYLQIFVISSGTDTRYFANTTKRDKNSFDFTIQWAKVDNSVIKDLKDFTATFFQKNVVSNVLFKYSVFDVSNTLLIMRPYQIAATERILWKIKNSYHAKKWSNTEGGGFIWHTTGSGKTLTSFKAALLATELDFIDKVLFVVDRKDLDFKTIQDYKKFSPESVNGSSSTAGLKANLEMNDNKIVVTTIQKLNNLMKSENDLPIYNKQVVFIFDECHRSQFGEAQKNLRKKFKKYYQFGFTGTPIFPQNALGADTTRTVFGEELHSYVIVDAIRDHKVLKFKVDYNDVRPQFKAIESEIDENKLSAAETKEAFLHPNRIKEITKYILRVFKDKTHRKQGSGHKGFNAMFAVNCIDAAKLYYEAFRKLQKERDDKNKLKVATIFSFAANEVQNAKGDVEDETFEPTALDSSAKEFLASAIKEYNTNFSTNFSLDNEKFQNYYRDVAQRVGKLEIDLLIVVGMFLTGFDAPKLNTLFVDKNLRYHGLIQAYSRTNRILDATKCFGNIVTFRNLEQATIDAISLFGHSSTRELILEKSYKEYMYGFTDNQTGKASRGFIDIVQELHTRFPIEHELKTEKDKKKFTQLFGEFLRVENVLLNYDEYNTLKKMQKLDMNDTATVQKFKQDHYISDGDFVNMKSIKVPSERELQNYRSNYNDILEWVHNNNSANAREKTRIDWSNVVFEVDLIKSQEINLDYIMQLIFDPKKKFKNEEELIEYAKRIIRSSVGNRAKEGLIIDFIHSRKEELKSFNDNATMLQEFYAFGKKEMQVEAKKLIKDENLKEQQAKQFINRSLKKCYVNEFGTDIDTILPLMSPLKPNYGKRKDNVLDKLRNFVEKFKNIGGEV